MKRSEINKIIANAIAFFAKMNFHLPPFAYYSIEDWQKVKNNAREIFDLKLGWDITDFGSNDFYNKGLLLFTIRNGLLNDPMYSKPYAEKIMIVDENQVTPMHFHWNKMEDIINRGGGNLVVEIYGSTDDEMLGENIVEIPVDGFIKKIKSGGRIILAPGESVSLPRKIYHKFYGESGKGRVLVGEVSMVNDDDIDNRFYEEASRFPEIIEDIIPAYLLCKDYKKFLN